MPAADPRAHSAVYRALKDGRLVKPRCCEECGIQPESSRNLHAHHADYSEPLVVEWLCPKCHRRRPPGIREYDGGDVVMHMRWPDELAAQVKVAASESGMTRTDYVLWALTAVAGELPSERGMPVAKEPTPSTPARASASVRGVSRAEGFRRVTQK